jgi:hypothetical protein
MTRLTPFIALLLAVTAQAQAVLTFNSGRVYDQNSFCPKPWIGIQGFSPTDQPVTQALEYQMVSRGAPVRFSIFLTDALTNYWGNNDAFFLANSNAANIIISLDNSNAVAESNALISIIARYQGGAGGSGFTNRIWGIDAYNEPDGLPSYTNGGATQANDYIPYLKACRTVIDNSGYGRGSAHPVRLLGPCLSYDYIDGYAAALYNSNVWSMIDVVAAHDYFATPTGVQNNNTGVCTNAWQTSTNYCHPYMACGGGFPNLQIRLQNMQTWAATNGASPTVIIEEYGLFNMNPGDAQSACLFIGQAGAVVIFNAPVGPTTQCPWNNGLGGGLTNAYWDAAMNEFMNTACQFP